MLDLDKYLNITMEIKLNGNVLNIKQPSARTTKEIGKLESGMTEENCLDVKGKITQLILNNNEEGMKFTKEDIEEIPFKIQDVIVRKVAEMKFEVDTDPNS